MRLSRPLLACMSLALMLTGCTGDQTGTSTTSTAPRATTTTTAPPTTTTTMDEPCPDTFCVIYHIHPDATWSDGEPVTSEDFVHTIGLLAERPLPVGAVNGYDLVVDHEIVDDKNVVFVFSEVFGAWQTLFDVILPSHVLGEDGTIENALTTTAGPFILSEVEAGERIVLRRNSNYWRSIEPVSGSPLGEVSEIRFVPIETARDQLQALEQGEVDFLNPRPLQWMVEEVRGMENVLFDVGPGEFWEHIDFNHDDSLLSQHWVREVFALSIDRSAILDQTVRTIDSEMPALDNTVWMTNSVHYEPHFSFGHDPERARQLLEDRLCELGDDGVYTCQGRRMSFVWATTLGDEDRELQAEMVQDDLAEVGVELVIDLRTPSQLFSSDVFFGGPEVWQIINFSWKAGADPNLGDTTYACEGSAPNGYGALNVNRFCDQEVNDLIDSAGRIADAAERAEVYNDADSLYLGDLAVIPLYQKPSFMAWNNTISGPKVSLSRSTDLWNVAAWSGKDTVIVALDSLPDDLDPVAGGNENASMVLSAILAGAYGVTPDLEHVPVLIESAETIVRDS